MWPARGVAGNSAVPADHRGMPRRLLMTSALALVLLALLAARSGESRATRGEAPTLFGLNVPSLRALDEDESALGVRPAVVGTYADWAHAPDFPRALATRINARGAVPLISWEPWDSWRGGADQP